jgi:hypothetical protein
MNAYCFVVLPEILTAKRFGIMRRRFVAALYGYFAPFTVCSFSALRDIIVTPACQVNPTRQMGININRFPKKYFSDKRSGT